MKKALVLMLAIGMMLLGVVNANPHSDKPDVPPGPPSSVPGTPGAPIVPSPGGPEGNGNAPFIVPPPFQEPPVDPVDPVEPPVDPVEQTEQEPPIA